MPATVSTTCPYCGVGCGVLASRDHNGKIEVRGDPAHPANRGRLCSKGSTLAETLDLSGRLLNPEIGGRRTNWDTALSAVADGFSRVIAEHGPDAVALYVSGQLLTEDYYVANKLMKGFIGSANIDTNSRLCMASAVAGHKRAFGADTVPTCYQDLEEAELVVLVGSNLAWCHPILNQRLQRARERNPQLKLVVIDPRRTDSCDGADLHLPLAPGSDVMLFNGLLAHLVRYGAVNFKYLEQCTEGAADAIAAAEARSPDIPTVAAACGLKEADVSRFYHLFTSTQRTVTLFSQGVNQSSAGTDKVNAIINCHLLTGRIGCPGMGPFSITGQPNAMGGREVGGLANQLAAHMGFTPENIARVGRFWKAPRIAEAPGLKAVELFDAVYDGRIKAIWIMATNPVVSLPDADRVRAALQRCEMVVVSDCVRDTDTVQLAHIRLPALTWGEKDGTVTNSERRISRQRPFLAAPGAAKPDWWIICEVAKRMGFEAGFRYQSPYQIFREHAALSAFENCGTRAFNIGALADIDLAAYQTLQPVQWPLPTGARQGQARLFAPGERFYTPSGRARLVPVTPRPPANPASEDFPLLLNSGRIRDQWHTMTRTGKVARLSGHTPEPFLALHPDDAAQLGLADGSLARVRSRWGEAILRARHDVKQRLSEVFAPMHWSNQFSARARIDAVINPVVDPLSGEPEYKHTPVAVERIDYAWYAFALSRQPLPDLPGSYWTRIQGHEHYRYELAGDSEVDWENWLRRSGLDGEWVKFQDQGCGQLRIACVHQGRIAACVFIADTPALPSRAWLAGLFERTELDGPERLALLSAQPPHGQTDAGRTVCSCFGIGENTIRAAIAGGCTTLQEVTRKLKAGGNCGSCVPDIKQLIEKSHRGAA